MSRNKYITVVISRENYRNIYNMLMLKYLGMPEDRFMIQRSEHADEYMIRMSQDLFDEFEEFLKSFDIDLDDNDVDIAKAKKPDPMYCNCDKPDIVKRGFSHIAYDYCKTCRKEKVSE